MSNFPQHSYINPINLRPNDAAAIDDAVLQAQLNQWRTNGYALFDNLFSTELIDQAKQDINDLYALKKEAQIDDFGAFGFPFESDCINAISLHPTLINIAKSLLGGEEIMLSQAQAWKKQSSANRNKLSNQVHIHVIIIINKAAIKTNLIRLQTN